MQNYIAIDIFRGLVLGPAAAETPEAAYAAIAAKAGRATSAGFHMYLAPPGFPPVGAEDRKIVFAECSYLGDYRPCATKESA